MLYQLLHQLLAGCQRESVRSTAAASHIHPRRSIQHMYINMQVIYCAIADQIMEQVYTG